MKTSFIVTIVYDHVKPTRWMMIQGSSGFDTNFILRFRGRFLQLWTFRDFFHLLIRFSFFSSRLLIDFIEKKFLSMFPINYEAHSVESSEEFLLFAGAAARNAIKLSFVI